MKNMFDRQIVDILLKKSNVNLKHLDISRLKGGCNNQVFKIILENRQPLILKKYFFHEKDKRQRLNAEFSFLEYAWQEGIRCLPQPIYKSQEDNIGLYDFIFGRQISSKDVTKQNIAQVIDFFLALNKNKNKGHHLSKGSEACLSYEDYCCSIECRIKKLNLSNSREVVAFTNKKLKPIWDEVLLKAKRVKGCFKIDENDYCISPSDIGFHNALITKDEKIFFIDFEYAGWDDPAKLVCDFFAQPRMVIPKKYFDYFSQKIALILSEKEKFLERVNIVFPICQLKWSCIMLNSFLPIDDKRRKFADFNEDVGVQIKKADKILDQIKL